MTHADIIAKWPSLPEFAADLGVQYGTAKQWKRRSSIPDNYWLHVVGAAAARDFAGVTLEALAVASAMARPVPAGAAA
jgi:hypothetical protein